MRVTEIFHSIQGESTFAGQPCVFVRLTGCPLRCTWCDTEYAFYGGSDVPIEAIAVGDAILVRGGEVVPIDGIVASPSAMIDESVLTGEPMPVLRKDGERARSGTVNAGDTFEMRATATAGESTYAGIVKLVAAAQTAKAPFIRLADRFALLLFPVALLVAGGAWFISGDPIRGLAVLVAVLWRRWRSWRVYRRQLLRAVRLVHLKLRGRPSPLRVSSSCLVSV